MWTFVEYRLNNGTSSLPMAVAFRGAAVNIKASFEANFPQLAWEDVEVIRSWVSSSVIPDDVWCWFAEHQTVSAL